jgi:aryl-alcohol dehydrogenase-like predicted oxidoreductase
MGTMTFGGKGAFAKVGDVSLAEARRLIDLVADAGVNLIDTADIYSAGAAESMLGEAMGGKRKPGMLIATKARFPTGEGPNEAGLSRWHLIRACEASLKRLRTDVIDLYQVHQWDGVTPLEETLEALDSLVRAGKVRYIGCSNFSGWHVMKAMEIARRDGRIPFVSQQIHYTLQAREAEYELIPIALDQKLGVLVWSPLAGGLLSGKHRRNRSAPEGTRVTAGWKEPPIADEGKLWDIVDELVAIGEAHRVSAARVALAWTLGRPGVISLVIGGRTEAQFKDNLACVEVKLTAEERARLDKVSQPTLLYPYWHQAWTASERLGAPDLALLAPYLAK